MDQTDDGFTNEFLLSQMQGVDDFISSRDLKCPVIQSSKANSTFNLAQSLSSVITRRKDKEECSLNLRNKNQSSTICNQKLQRIMYNQLSQ
jgi:hypothetical protein